AFSGNGWPAPVAGVAYSRSAGRGPSAPWLARWDNDSTTCRPGFPAETDSATDPRSWGHEHEPAEAQGDRDGARPKTRFPARLACRPRQRIATDPRHPADPYQAPEDFRSASLHHAARHTAGAWAPTV